MEKIKALVLAILMFVIILLFGSKAEAVFSIDLNFYSISFGSMNMGDIKDDVPAQGLVVRCTTDQGNAWYLKIRNDRAFTHLTNPASIIPNVYFKWYGESTSVSTNTSLVKTRQDFTIERTVYTGAAGEGASGTDITMKFELTLPPVVQSGTYSTAIIFTLTE